MRFHRSCDYTSAKTSLPKYRFDGAHDKRLNSTLNGRIHLRPSKREYRNFFFVQIISIYRKCLISAAIGEGYVLINNTYVLASNTKTSEKFASTNIIVLYVMSFFAFVIKSLKHSLVRYIRNRSIRQVWNDDTQFGGKYPSKDRIWTLKLT